MNDMFEPGNLCVFTNGERAKLTRVIWYDASVLLAFNVKVHLNDDARFTGYSFDYDLDGTPYTQGVPNSIVKVICDDRKH